jgi:hypothetical protein
VSSAVPLVRRPRKAAAGLVGVLFLTAGCQATARVTVHVKAGGDGDIAVSLTLDRQAAAQFPDLPAQLKLADLRNVGWTVSGPVTASDGTETVTADHRFRDAAGATAVVDELSGPAGPFHSLRIQTRHGFVTTRTRLTGTVDLRRGVDAFADPNLGTQLGVPSLAQGLAVLHHGGETAGLTLELAARLPGHASHTAWALPLGKLTAVSADATSRNWLNLAFAAVGVVALLGLLVVGLHRIGLRFGLGEDRWERRARRHRKDTWRISERKRRW